MKGRDELSFQDPNPRVSLMEVKGQFRKHTLFVLALKFLYTKCTKRRAEVTNVMLESQ